MKNDVTVFVIHLRHNTAWSGLDISLPRLIAVCNNTQARRNADACKIVTSDISLIIVSTGGFFMYTTRHMAHIVINNCISGIVFHHMHISTSSFPFSCLYFVIAYSHNAYSCA